MHARPGINHGVETNFFENVMKRANETNGNNDDEHKRERQTSLKQAYWRGPAGDPGRRRFYLEPIIVFVLSV